MKLRAFLTAVSQLRDYCANAPQTPKVRHMTTALEGGHIPPSRMQYRLLIARLEADLSQPELAERMGVSRNVISNAENGRSKPRKIVMNAWALATGVPLSWLLNGDGSWQPPSDDPEVRPKGFEPLTFCLEVAPNVTSIFPNHSGTEQDRTVA